jgi:hypothetical protein
VTRSGFGDPAIEEQMRARMRPMIARQKPLALPLLMGGGKAANPLKVGPNYLPDLSEWVSWSLLEAIGIAITGIYPPGARVIPIPDAGLHSADLGMPIEETLTHAATAQRDLARLGITHVIVPDVLPHLGSDWVEGVSLLMAEVRGRAATDSAFAMDIKNQIQSLVYSLNTRVMGRSFDELLPMYAAVAGYTEGVSEEAQRNARELVRRSEDIAFHYVGVNWAIRQLRLVERIVTALMGSPDHLRLSVHAKPGEPRPQLFTPSKHFPSLGGLLPMHAVGVRLTSGSKVRYGAAFELAARLRGWTPVAEPETGRFLWFAADVPVDQA